MVWAKRPAVYYGRVQFVKFLVFDLPLKYISGIITARITIDNMTGRLKSFARKMLTPRKHMQSTFAPFYSENRWGDSESASGPGSSLERTAKLRSELPILLEEIGARTLLDAPCGDFNWMKNITLNLDQYIGVDVIPELIDR